MIRSLLRLVRKLKKRVAARPEVVSAGRDPSWEIYKSYISVHPSAIIAPSATIKIFNPPEPKEVCLEIGEGSHVFSNFALLRPQSKIKIGKNCQLGNSQFICAERIYVGDDVMMAWGVTIMDNDAHALDWEERKFDASQCYQDYVENPSNIIKNKDWSSVRIKSINLGNKCWIGFNVSILKGVQIGKNSVIAACSVVVNSVPDYSLAAGNPAKVIRRFQESKTQHKI